MYLGTYTFTGDRRELSDAYDRLVASFPADAILFHAAVGVDEGLVVIDTCPSQADFDSFSTSAAFRDALAAAGLPEPVVAPLGAVHAARFGRDVFVP